MGLSCFVLPTRNIYLSFNELSLVSRGARLQKLYTSWENNPDIGFVAMKVKKQLCCYQILDSFTCNISSGKDKV